VTTCNAGVFVAATCNPDCNATALTVSVSGGSGTCTGMISSGSSCDIICNTGFTSSGSNNCLQNGSFANPVATCDQDCDLTGLAEPSNGHLGTCTGTLSSGQSCTISCYKNATLSGSVSCSDGVITNTASCTICDSCTCNFSSPLNGASGDCPSVMSHGETCTPTCDTGYLLSGSTTCSQGILSPLSTCNMFNYSDHVCDFQSGYSFENKNWHGCMGVSRSSVGYSSDSPGTCVAPSGHVVTCADSCRDTCRSSMTVISQIVASPPVLNTLSTIPRIRCTDFFITIQGRAFDSDTPSNNEVTLTLQSSSGVSKTFSGACTVTESTYDRLYCQYNTMNCSDVVATPGSRDRLFASVRIL